MAGSLVSQDEPRNVRDRTHWSLRALTNETPEVAAPHPVDGFILSQLSQQGIPMNPKADGPTLLRRMTLDLTGLPPTRQELADFLQAWEAQPEAALEQLVDRLLASPHYGERYGRHWLDVARYVQGTVKVPGVKVIDMAEPYRDYVVSSFNQDKPYDVFIKEQLAGDLLVATQQVSDQAYLEKITAPAFLSIGQWFDECTDPNRLRLDIIDEQISTLTKAFLAMDFACARCHDHKTDPIPTRDYYAMAGILRSTRIVDTFSESWRDGRSRDTRHLASLETEALIQAQDEERAKWLGLRLALLEEARDQALAAGRGEPGDFVWGTPVATMAAENFAGHKDLKISQIGERSVVETRRRLDQWVRYRFDTPAAGDYLLMVLQAQPEAAPVKLEINGQLQTSPERVMGSVSYGRSPEHFRWVAVALPGLKKGSNHFRFLVGRDEAFPIVAELQVFSGASLPDASSIVHHYWPPTAAAMEPVLDAAAQERLAQIDAALAKIEEARPRVPLTLAVSEEPQMEALPVHIGGDVYRTEDEVVPRGVPTLVNHLVSSASYEVPESTSGRQQLADWLSDPEHPLTARVMVNRIWQWHFGTGLVRTSDDFGKTGSFPSHPALLDWLAGEFIRSGWSVKHMHRLIMLSDTYQSDSQPGPLSREKDADGRLLSFFPARRLEIEAIFDGMMTSVGKVPRQAPGAVLDTSKSKDRAMYILTSSRSPKGMGIEIRKMFPLFGFDDSGRPMHQRDGSTSPQQALWWLNNPLPLHFSTELAKRALADSDDAAERVAFVYETIFGKPADSLVVKAVTDYVGEGMKTVGLTEEEAWARACLGLFSSRQYSYLE